MKHLVLLAFVDAVSGIFFVPGTFFECNDYDRINDLHDKGYIQKNNDSEKLKVEKQSEPENTEIAGAPDEPTGDVALNEELEKTETIETEEETSVETPVEEVKKAPKKGGAKDANKS